MDREDEKDGPALDAATRAKLLETTNRVLASLTPREQRILKLRFGIDVNADPPEAKGRQFFDILRRIRETEARALAELDRRKRIRRRYDYRAFEPGDLPLVAKWLRRPHVARWWGESEGTLVRLRRDLVARCEDAQILLFDEQPVGYPQVYDASLGAEGGVLGQAPGTRGLDMFIGEPSLIGQGHGPVLHKACLCPPFRRSGGAACDRRSRSGQSPLGPLLREGRLPP